MAIHILKATQKGCTQTDKTKSSGELFLCKKTPESIFTFNITRVATKSIPKGDFFQNIAE